MTDNIDADTIIFRAIWRSPKYPVIIKGADRLRTARSLKGLAMACLQSPISEYDLHLIVIDITGDEFWYVPDAYVITPGFIHKRWTKKRLIELYNQSENARKSGVTYSERSLGNKTHALIFNELCTLIKR